MSPLALLAQTCSQIGADTPSLKPLSPLEKSKKDSTNDDVSFTLGKDKYEKKVLQTPRENKLVFKPYESDVGNKKIEKNHLPTKCNIQHLADEKKKEIQYTGRKSASPSTNYSSTPNSEYCRNSSEETSMLPLMSTSPIIRPGNEILQEHSKHFGTYKSIPSGLTGNLNPVYCFPGIEHTNPAFRPSFSGIPFSNQQQSGIFSSGNITSSLGTYVSYARVKTPSGEENLVPVCRDPFCTGCHFSISNQQLSNGPSNHCSSGCNQCDHQKYNLAMAISSNPHTPHVSSSAIAYMQIGRPYICNWIAGDTYCGRRFVTSDELLQHLRSHTNSSDSNSVTSLLPSHSLFSSTTLHRSSYPNPPLSPLSARYNPYSKPTLPVSLAASPYSAFSTTALGAYYSIYSLYGRIGATAVHP